ncbi:MAG: hypothetical protein AAGG81_03160, partial [Chlamydiota bacterium]
CEQAQKVLEQEGSYENIKITLEATRNRNVFPRSSRNVFTTPSMGSIPHKSLFKQLMDEKELFEKQLKELKKFEKSLVFAWTIRGLPKELKATETFTQLFLNKLYNDKTVDKMVNYSSEEIIKDCTKLYNYHFISENTEYALNPYREFQVGKKFEEYWWELDLDNTSDKIKTEQKKDCIVLIHEKVGELVKKRLQYKPPENLDINFKVEFDKDGLNIPIEYGSPIYSFETQLETSHQVFVVTFNKTKPNIYPHQEIAEHFLETLSSIKRIDECVNYSSKLILKGVNKFQKNHITLDIYNPIFCSIAFDRKRFDIVEDFKIFWKKLHLDRLRNLDKIKCTAECFSNLHKRVYELTKEKVQRDSPENVNITLKLKSDTGDLNKTMLNRFDSEKAFQELLARGSLLVATAEKTKQSEVPDKTFVEAFMDSVSKNETVLELVEQLSEEITSTINKWLEKNVNLNGKALTFKPHKVRDIWKTRFDLSFPWKYWEELNMSDISSENKAELCLKCALKLHNYTCEKIKLKINEESFENLEIDLKADSGKIDITQLQESGGVFFHYGFNEQLKHNLAFILTIREIK